MGEWANTSQQHSILMQSGHNILALLQPICCACHARWCLLSMNQVSHTHQHLLLKWICVWSMIKGYRIIDCQSFSMSHPLVKCEIESTPSTLPSKYHGQKADIKAQHGEESTACIVCSISNMESCTRSFCLTACNCIRSSSLSDDTAVVIWHQEAQHTI